MGTVPKITLLRRKTRARLSGRRSFTCAHLCPSSARALTRRPGSKGGGSHEGYFQKREPLPSPHRLSE